MFGASKTKQVSAGGYAVNNSLRFRRANNAYLNRTPASAGNRKTWTLSTWVKKGVLDVDQIFMECWAANNDNDLLNISWRDSNKLSLGAYNIFYRETTAVYRDVGSWYHVVVAVDTTQATASNRIKMYVNGSLITNFDTSNDPAQNANLGFNQAYIHYIGARNGSSINLDGYLSQYYFIDGQQLTPSSFGATDASTGVWQPTAYTGSYGTNGFYLPFSDIALTSGSNAGLGKDFSGNGNYWNTNNISVTSGSTYDAMTDVPTLTSATVANYATLNTLFVSGSNGSTSDGNLTTVGGGNPCRVFPSTIAVNNGNKFYAEYKVVGSGNYIQVGVSDVALYNYTSGGVAGNGNITFDTNQSNNNYYINSTSPTSTSGSTVANDIIMVAFDSTTRKVWFGKNGTWNGSGDPAAGTNEVGTLGGTSAMMFFCRAQSTTLNANFGQQPWAYTIPSGFKALNTYNLPTPAIGASSTTLANKYFAPTLYTGNGTSQSITNSGAFQPDLVWTKSRSNAYNNTLVDAVRGVSRSLVSDLTDAEDYSPGSYVTAFNSNGFSVGTGTGSNGNGATYVGWQWKGGNGTVSNTSGSITSTVSANQTAGFSVVTYTGTGSSGTIGHGLNAVPQFIILKKRSAASNSLGWVVWAFVNGVWQYSKLNGTDNFANAGETSPTSSVFSILTNTDVNANGATYVAYCFTSISGFSSIGTYVANGSTDGSFIYTGFRPAYVMLRHASSVPAGGDWQVIDSARNPYNLNSSNLLSPDSSAAENTNNIYNAVDLLSNGFKIRGQAGYDTNNNGTTYIYMAFAENPFKYALAR